MRIPRRKSLALAATVGAALTLLTPTAASAAYYGDETDYAEYSPSGPSGSYSCAGSFPGVIVCYKPNDDLIYVKDTTVGGRPDGYAAVAEWKVDYGVRWGSCVNREGTGKWAVCDKNFPEDKHIDLWAAAYDSGDLVMRQDWDDRVSRTT